MSGMPNVFLSLSGQDEHFVSQVADLLPPGLATFYSKSFENGENLISAMEERISGASIFVLFASRASLDSKWVAFEIDRARLNRIKRSDLRLLVFIIDTQVSHTDLPQWMLEHWVPRAGSNPRDVSRYIRNILFSPGISASPTGHGFGRGQLIDLANQRIREVAYRTSDIPNVFVLAGINGIGRRTVARQLMQHAFPGSPEIVYGPEFSLSQYADLADIYRMIRQEVDPHFSITTFTEDLRAFSNLSEEECLDEICRGLSHFASLGQGVTVVTGNGIFEDRGNLKSWALQLFKRLAKERSVKFCAITNRQIQENELTTLSNVLQFPVPPLPDGEIRAIMIATAPAFGAKPDPPGDMTLKLIGGHPGTAKSATRLIAQKGLYVFEQNPRDLIDIQEEVLRENIDVGALTDLEREVLSILSWVPQLNADLLRDVLIPKHNINDSTFASTLEGLILGCLVVVTGSNYAISSPVRSLFRRNYGFGSPELLGEFARVLRKAWERSISSDELRIELFDAIVYLTELERKSIPPEFRQLLLPSTLHDVLRETYDQGHDDIDALRRVTAWGANVQYMRMDETTREAILSLVVRSHVRMSEYARAEEVLSVFDRLGYRSAAFLRGFMLRRSGRLPEAVAQLQEARRIRKNYRSVIQELASCYSAQARWPELSRLIQEEDGVVERSPFLLNTKIGMLLGKRKFQEAAAAIARLRLLPGDDGRADGRYAHLLMKRDHNLVEAERRLTALIDRRTKGQIGVRKLRAIVAIANHNLPLARQDIEFVRSKPGTLDETRRLEIRFKLASGDTEGARGEFTKITSPSAYDYVLEARILDSEAEKPSTTITERGRLRQRAAELRARYDAADEFNLDF